MSAPRPHLAEATIGVLVVVAMLAASLWILRPFIGPLIWAAMVVVATWPVMRALQARFGGRRWPAVTLMTLLLLLLFVVPLTVAIVTIVRNADLLIGWARAAAAFRMEAPPPWLVGLPVVGEWLAELWQQLVDAGIDGVFERVAPYAGNATRWFVAEVGGVGVLLLQFMLTVALAAVLYANGEAWALMLRRLGHRLGGPRGEHVVELAGAATRGVALGVGVPALVHAVVGRLGLSPAGVRSARLRTAVMCMMCLAQLGPAPVLIPATIWLFWQGETGWGIFALVATVVVGTADNFIRPLLIRLGADLPLLLILAGVIGGLFAFGLVGIFVGPVLLTLVAALLRYADDSGVGQGLTEPAPPASAPVPPLVEAAPPPAAAQRPAEAPPVTTQP